MVLFASLWHVKVDLFLFLILLEPEALRTAWPMTVPLPLRFEVHVLEDLGGQAKLAWAVMTDVGCQSLEQITTRPEVVALNRGIGQASLIDASANWKSVWVPTPRESGPVCIHMNENADYVWLEIGVGGGHSAGVVGWSVEAGGSVDRRLSCVGNAGSVGDASGRTAAVRIVVTGEAGCVMFLARGVSKKE